MNTNLQVDNGANYNNANQNPNAAALNIEPMNHNALKKNHPDQK